MDYSEWVRRDQPNARGEGRDSLRILAASLIFMTLGFLLASFVGSYLLSMPAFQQAIGLTAQDVEFFTTVVAEPLLQLVCALPMVFCSLFPVIAVLTLLVNRHPRSSYTKLNIVFASLSFLLGLIVYVPIEFLLLFSAAL